MNVPAIVKALPSPEDIALARESGRALSTVLLTRSETQQSTSMTTRALCVLYAFLRRHYGCCWKC